VCEGVVESRGCGKEGGAQGLGQGFGALSLDGLVSLFGRGGM
jgi:hypothetical protein